MKTESVTSNVRAATRSARPRMKQAEYGLVLALHSSPDGMLRGFHILFLFAVLTATPAWARAPKAPGLSGNALRTTRKEEPKKGGAKPLLLVTVRPTWYQSETLFELENTIEAGIQFSDKFALTYVQDFNTNISKTGNAADAGDVTPVLQDGFIRMNFFKIRESDDKLFTFNDQVRVYFPTEQVKRDAGLVTIVRNYFVFTRKISESVNFWFYEVPILHVYDRAERTLSDGKTQANPVFENRLILEPMFTLFPRVTLGIPINLSTVKFRDAGEKAAKSGEWIPSITITPWLEWAATDFMTFGMYYETGNLSEVTDAGLVWTTGQTSGLFQAYVRFGL